MNMNQEAQTALDIIEKTSANLFLTGKAGTGKTTFLKNLRDLSPKRMIVLAPTGIAAINAGGQTIHSFFQLPLSPFIPGTAFASGENNRRYKFSNAKRNIIRTLDLLVIDEISMVRGDLLDAVDDVMRRYRKHDRPFGGVQLLMIGDLHQLAPVTTGTEENLLRQYYDTPYFFSSRALQQAGYLTVELKTVYRQQDDKFITLLNQIRTNQASDATLAELNKRYIPNFTPPKEADYIRLTTHNGPAQQINEHELALLDYRQHTFQAEVEGDFPEMSYPTDYNLVLKEGAQIMFIKNDPEHRFYNGMVGEIVNIDNDDITVKSKETQEQFVLERAEWTNSKYTLNEQSMEIEEDVQGRFRQYPIRLAWAITIHKSQGLTFEHAIIDASHSFTHGQTYVALSRCKSLEGMVLSAPLSRGAIITDNQVDAFTQSIQPPTRENLQQLELAYTIQNIDDLFGFATMAACHEQVMRTIAEFFASKYQKLIQEYREKGVVFKSLMQVAAKFKMQYSAMLCQNDDVLTPEIQERIHKGAAYFADKTEIFQHLIDLTNIKTENKVARKLLNERMQALEEEVKLKSKLLNYFAADNAFSVSEYLTRKAQFLLGTEFTAKGKSKSKERKTVREEHKSSEKEYNPSGEAYKSQKEEKQKEPKVPTRQISYDMYKKGMTVEEIAKERDYVPSTIMSHLTGYIVDGDIDIRNFVSADHEQSLRQYMTSHPDSPFSEIRAALDESCSYDEIRIVANIMEKEKTDKQQKA